MAEQNLAEERNENAFEVPRTAVMTGDRNRRMHLYYQLIQDMETATQIDIIVSFLMESGVRMLLNDLGAAINRGAKVRILTGNYLGITQPSALYLIKQKLTARVDLRFYNEKGRSFHPKAYIFHYQTYGEIYIGSSNISRSALTSGIEWNYRFSSRDDRLNFEQFSSTFEDLFENHAVVIDNAQLEAYSRSWHEPAAARNLKEYDESEEDSAYRVLPMFEPRGAQIEALCALENTRAEGAKKALVLAATGIGKTVLAAFDSKPYERVLFVAHREEILQQAATTFRNIRGSSDYGFFKGDDKCTDKPLIFASVSTLGNTRYLRSEYFSPTYFQYIIIDEIHHGVANQYRRIVEYFRPEFLLGLTATPERMDGRSIYELCDYNVPYEISMREAINKGMLVPFRYYGIYDDTADYGNLRLVRGHFDVHELDRRFVENKKRQELIFKYYCKYGSQRALGFCCSRAHAEDMARAFAVRGIPAVSVYSGSAETLTGADWQATDLPSQEENGAASAQNWSQGMSSDFLAQNDAIDSVQEGTGVANAQARPSYRMNRNEAIEKLKKGEIRVIFSVDMFNEGVDITSVDMVMFLRPTESPVVFLQQLGRGLRCDRNKEYLNVLDFIGNYERAGNVRQYLTGGKNVGKQYDPADKSVLPDNCIVDFDMRLLDLFQMMDKKQVKVKQRIQNEYLRVKEQIGHRPLRMDLFTYMEEDTYQIAIEHSKDNPFRNYLAYLKENKELSLTEQRLWNGLGREFLNVLETTSMSKVYKMPVLMTFYNYGDIRMEVTDEELLATWKEFFNTGTNWKDLDKNMTYEKYKNISDRDHIRKICQMPVHFLQESGKGFFVQKEGATLALHEDLRNIIKDPAFVEHFGDIITYRAMDYYKRRYENRKKEG